MFLLNIIFLEMEIEMFILEKNASSFTEISKLLKNVKPLYSCAILVICSNY